MQELEFVDDHVRVEDCPLEIDVGFAVSEAVGVMDVTVTVALVDADALPFEQVMKYVVVVGGVTLTEPEIAFPVEKPLPMQEVALVDDQVRVDDWPLVIDVGFAVSDTGIAGAVTVTVAFADAEVLPLVQLTE